MSGIIQNYGLFWRRDSVFWGWQNQSGHLKGVLAGAKKSTPVDFADQRAIYCLYDDNREITYIGQTGAKNDRLFARMKAHTKDRHADRWTRFSWFGLRWVKNTKQLASDTLSASAKMGPALNHLEAILIAAVEPPDNRQGGRFGNEVEQYVQFRDDKLNPPPDQMLEEIWEKVKAL